MADFMEESYRKRRTADQARDVVLDAYREVNGEELPTITLRKFKDEWLAVKRSSTAPSTYQRYESTLSRFQNYVDTALRMGDQDIALIKKTHIQEYINYLNTQLTPSSCQFSLKVLRMMFEDVRREDYRSDNPAQLVKTAKHTSRAQVRRPFTIDELRAVLEVADGEWKGIILTGLYTGMRLGDIVTLKRLSYDPDSKSLNVCTGKTQRRVILPVVPPLAEYLDRVLPDSPEAPFFPFANNTAETQGRTGTLSNQFRKILVRAHLASPKSKKNTGQGHGKQREQSELSFHCLRHTTTSMLKNAGVSEAVAMDIIGHESTAISRQYTHIESAAKRDALGKLPNLTDADNNP